MENIKKIHIREAAESDLPCIYLFEREYIIEHEKENLHKWDGAKDNIMKMLHDNIERMFVAQIEKELVGHGYWSYHEEKPCVFSIYVAKQYRGCGIARALMSSIEDQILSCSHKEVTLSTLESNPAYYLFSKMNYKEINRSNGWINFIKEL